MKCFRLFISLEKEENWLNEMARKGYLFWRECLGVYEFKQLDGTEKTIIKMDYRNFTSHMEYIDYCTLFEDSGWKHIWGDMYVGNQYFQRVAEDASEDIFSDSNTRAEKYKRLADKWRRFSIIYFSLAIIFYTYHTLDVNRVIHFKEFYHTPGIWQMTGFDFWRAFLLETPIAVVGALANLSLIIVVIISVYIWLYSYRKYYSQRSLTE